MLDYNDLKNISVICPFCGTFGNKKIKQNGNF